MPTRPTSVVLVLLTMLLTTAIAAAQEALRPLTLDAAIARAQAANPDVAVAAAAEAEAQHGRRVARAAWFPRIEVLEGWQRGNQPVFVFSSLLGQRRFSEANFAIDALNDPDALDNHRASITASERVFDGGRTRAEVGAADAAVALARDGRRQTSADITLAVIQAYAQALAADATARAAAAAIDAAASDLARATARRDAGMATDADVLSVDVHLAQMRARRVAAGADAQIARAMLNRLMNEPLDTVVELVEPTPALTTSLDAPALEVEALASRPDVAQAASRVELARARERIARAALVPAVSVEGGYEWNGGAWASRSASWVVGVRAQLSLSSGGAEVAASRAARSALERSEAERLTVESAARLEVLAARTRLESARARVSIASATVAQARESERIIRDRHEAGLATTTDLLRAASALLDAEALAVGARSDLLVSAARLEHALGRLGATQP